MGDGSDQKENNLLSSLSLMSVGSRKIRFEVLDLLTFLKILGYGWDLAFWQQRRKDGDGQISQTLQAKAGCGRWIVPMRLVDSSS